jgi:hypothetical protein
MWFRRRYPRHTIPDGAPAMTLAAFRDLVLRSGRDDWICHDDGPWTLKSDLNVRIELEHSEEESFAGWLVEGEEEACSLARTLWYGYSPVLRFEMVQVAPAVELPLPYLLNDRLTISELGYHLAELMTSRPEALGEYVKRSGIDVEEEPEPDATPAPTAVARALRAVAGLRGRVRQMVRPTLWRSGYRQPDV